MTYAEIKPLSISGVAAGVAHISTYELAFRGRGYTRETWPDDVRGTHVGQIPDAIGMLPE